MAKSLYKDFKEKFKFLEKHGFIFTKDPMNPDRPCYKNYFGEIGISHKKTSALEHETMIFVQMNGWRQNIDVISEYKKIFGKKALTKDYSKLFRELFEKLVSETGEFYDLKVYVNNKYQMPIDEVEEFIIKEDIKADLNTSLKKEGLNLPTILTFTFLFFALLFLEIAKTDFKISDDSIILFNNIQVAIIAIINTFIFVLTFRYTDLLSKISLIAFSVIHGLTANMLDRKLAYKIWFIYFFIALIILVLYIIKYLIKKIKKILVMLL